MLSGGGILLSTVARRQLCVLTPLERYEEQEIEAGVGTFQFNEDEEAVPDVITSNERQAASISYPALVSNQHAPPRQQAIGHASEFRPYVRASKLGEPSVP